MMVLLPCGFKDAVVFGIVQTDGGRIVGDMTILTEPDREPR